MPLKYKDLQQRAGARKGMVIINVPITLAADMVDKNIFTADQAYRLVSAEWVHGATNATDTLQVEKLTGTTAPGSGTEMLTGTFDIGATINTVIPKSPSATEANTKLADGDRIGIDVTGTISSAPLGVLTLVLIPEPDKLYWVTN